MTTAYKGAFTCWTDVQTAFEMNTPEPEEVLLAEYDKNNYDGEATVVYRNGIEYAWVEANHCSCYELEGQWEPEFYDFETLILATERRIKVEHYNKERIDRLTPLLSMLNQRKQEEQKMTEEITYPALFEAKLLVDNLKQLHPTSGFTWEALNSLECLLYKHSRELSAENDKRRGVKQ